MYVGPRWRVAHAFGTSLPGWLVVLPRRHVIALDELTAEEAADLGPLLRALTAALREVLGCSKTYVALFAEAEGFAHIHFHVVPRSPDLDQLLRGGACSACLAAIPPVICPTRRWTRRRPASGRPSGGPSLSRVNTDKMRMQKSAPEDPLPGRRLLGRENKQFAEMNLTDHAGVRLTHGKPKVNGVEIHYAIGGAGEPVFLLHGVPKTMSYWRHVDALRFRAEHPSCQLIAPAGSSA